VLRSCATCVLVGGELTTIKEQAGNIGVRCRELRKRNGEKFTWSKSPVQQSLCVY
jgi:hypothetical protein